MIKKPTVTIGIPAYNEEANIGSLLKQLMHQKEKNFHLKRIIVSSDGSTDNTAAAVKSIKNKKIILFDNNKRKGLARGLNQITEKTNSDILVFLDADIVVKDKYLISKLIKPIITEKMDLASCRIEEEQPENFIEKALFISMQLKSNLFESFKGGNNLFTCHGPVRALSRKMYKKILFPEGKGNDMYSYLFAVANGFSYKYVKDASIFYRLPGNLRDHKNQSFRFHNSIKAQRNYFSDTVIKSETRIPLTSYLLGALKSVALFIRYPVHIFFYIFVNEYLKFASVKHSYGNDLWKTVTSSKTL